MADLLPPPPPYALHDPTPRLPVSVSNPSPSATANSALYISAAPYFEMRPSTRPKPSNTLPCQIACLADATVDDLPMPEPKQILADRDVDPHDWLTFVNHLIPYKTTNSSTSTKGKAVDQKRERGGAQSEMAALEPCLSEPERQQRVKAVVEGWNQNFFLPRGLEIVVRVEATPRSPSAARLQASRPPPSTSLPPGGRSPVESLQRASASRKTEGQRNYNKELGLALYHAVEKQDSQTSDVLLQAGADPSAKPNYEAPDIVVAVQKGNLQILKMLLEYGPDTNAYALGGGTALYNAVSKGKTDMVKILLRHGADPNKRPTGSVPALYKAVSKQFNDIFHLLLQHDVNIDDAPPGGTTAMYKAAAKGQQDLVRRLLAAGAKPDARPTGATQPCFTLRKRVTSKSAGSCSKVGLMLMPKQQAVIPLCGTSLARRRTGISLACFSTTMRVSALERAPVRVYLRELWIRGRKIWFS